MSSNKSKKPTRIKGVYRMKRAVQVQVIKPGQKKPRTELWNIYEEDEEAPELGSSMAPLQIQPAVIAAPELGQATESASTNATTETTYRKYKKKRTEKWTELRPLMVIALVEENSPEYFECTRCSEPTFEEYVRCLDCGPLAIFCPECCARHHAVIGLHKPERWKDGQFEPFPLPHQTWQRLGHDCTIYYTKPLLILDHKGCPHIEFFQFCHCEDEAITLVRLGFWPATPLNPAIAISMQLLSLLRSLIFAGQISLTAFTSSLKHRFASQFSKHPDVVKVFTWDMVLNYNLVHHEVTSLERVCPDLVPLQTCPACPEDGKTIAMDGNFSLVRRKRGGAPLLPNERHPERFLLPQKEVDDFVSKYQLPSSGKQECSNFQAGTVLRSKNKSDKLDVKGIFGSVCRHDYPYKFFDLKHGERMCYPVFLFNKIKDTTKVLLYDIACKFETHLKKQMTLPDGLTFAVPIFHVYGHQMHCQVSYNPRRIAGAGLADGEGTERLWSFLGDFSNITKEMTTENRHDLLTELLLHYSMKLTNQMVKNLCLKMEKACLTLASTEAEIVQMVASYPGNIAKDNILEWNEAEVESVKTRLPSVPDVDSWKSQYVLDLHDYYKRKEELDEDRVPDDDLDDQILELARKETKLRRAERKQKMQRWDQGSQQYQAELSKACESERKCRLLEVRDNVVKYTFLCYQRKAHSNGQGLAKRITKQVLASSKDVDTAIKKYNNMPSLTNETWNLSRHDALQLESQVYIEVLGEIDDTIDPQIPTSSKRKAIDVLNLNDRSREEIHNVCQDISQFKASVTHREQMLQTKLDELKARDYLERYELGSICLVKKAKDDLSKVQQEIEKSFSPILSQNQVNVVSLLDHIQTHIQSIENAPPQDLSKQELHVILEQIALFEREADELEEEQNNSDSEE